VQSDSGRPEMTDLLISAGIVYLMIGAVLALVPAGAGNVRGALAFLVGCPVILIRGALL
jgi:hypothetical protein